MKRHGLLSLAGLLVLGIGICWSLVAAAQANGIQQLELSLTEDEAIIRLASEGRLAEPRVAYRRGTIKMWFPNVPEDRRLEVIGDGDVIRRVRVRPGANGSALLTVDLGDKRKLKPGTALVEDYAAGSVVRIPRSALPEKAAAHTAPTDRADPASVASQATGQEPATPEVSEVEPEATKGPLFAVQGKQTDGVAAGHVESDLRGVSTAQGTPSLATRTTAEAKTPPTLVAMAVASVVLGLVLLALRFWNGRKPTRLALPNIEVIGTRRLGAKHQLVLVRALGEDHLLSMNGERTERIASAPSPGTQADAIKLLPPTTHTSLSLSLPAGLSDPANNNDQEADALEAASEKDAPFGAELLNFMARRSHPTWRPKSEEPRRESSPAVAGLLRLREREAS